MGCNVCKTTVCQKLAQDFELLIYLFNKIMCDPFLVLSFEELQNESIIDPLTFSNVPPLLISANEEKSTPEDVLGSRWGRRIRDGGNKAVKLYDEEKR